MNEDFKPDFQLPPDPEESPNDYKEKNLLESKKVLLYKFLIITGVTFTFIGIIAGSLWWLQSTKKDVSQSVDETVIIRDKKKLPISTTELKLAKEEQITPSVTSSVTTTDTSAQGNVATSNQLLSISGQTLTVKGFAIFATTHCQFRTPEHNPPPGLGAPCDRDSGYVVLSDKPLQQSRNLDPIANVTTLNQTEILIYYIPDKTIEGIQSGDFYEFTGETGS